MFSSSCSTRNQCRHWFQSSIWRITKMHKRDHRPLHPRCSGYGWITYWQTSVLSQPDSATLHCISDFLPDKWNNSFFADHRICYPNNNIHKWDWFSNRFTTATWVIQKYAKSCINTSKIKCILSSASDSDFASRLHHQSNSTIFYGYFRDSTVSNNCCWTNCSGFCVTNME